ncbi:choice-of-anchor D domain-containing protein [Bdellovibrio sp. BCCA]|uniref:choice-of-anchor D domain-containing protein n=1 Tax=Bdellovibrio sp. BCCA TaxID=3136281 RepID=UPI0030F186E2
MKLLFLLLLSIFFAVPSNADETSAPSLSEEVCGIVIGDEDMQIQTQYLFYNFGRTLVNTTKSVRFYLRNNGRFPFYINSINTNGDRFRDEENCPGVLWPGQRCTIRVLFRPNQVGLFTGSLEVDLIGREDTIVNLRGRGVWEF